MARGLTFLMIVAGLTALLSFAGISTGMGLLMEKLGIDILNNPENFGLTNLLITATGILTISIAGVALGFALGYRDPVTLLIAGYASLLISFVVDIIVLITYTKNSFGAEPWAYAVLTIVLFPIAIGYIHEMISWWSGK